MIESRVVLVSRVASAWCCIGLAMGFFYWTGSTGLDAFADASVGLASYLRAVLLSAPAAGALVAMLFVLKAVDWAVRVAAASLFIYVGSFAAAGWVAAAWAGLALTAGSLFLLRQWQARDCGALVILHLMGTSTGLYLIYSIERYWPGSEALARELRAVWRLISG